MSTLVTDFFTPARPRVIAHRGAGGDYPENTWPAFAKAVEAGASYLELDVHATRDGEIVVAHDNDLLRVASHDGVISEMTMAELEAVDAGFNFSRDKRHFPFRGLGVRVPRLKEILKTWSRLHFVIEFKPDTAEIADATYDAVKRFEMERRVLFASEHLTPIQRIRALAPQIPTNLPALEIMAFMQSLPPGAPPPDIGGEALQIPPEHQGWKLASPEIIAAAHDKGLEVHVFTVNEHAEMRQMLEYGVDGIITDYPARALALLGSR